MSSAAVSSSRMDSQARQMREFVRHCGGKAGGIIGQSEHAVGADAPVAIVLSGDGDIAGIGGNHFIHAARRNVDMTVICVNNFIYAMTGGQVAPTKTSRKT